jgi:hypothetical protein
MRAFLIAFFLPACAFCAAEKNREEGAKPQPVRKVLEYPNSIQEPIYQTPEPGKAMLLLIGLGSILMTYRRAWRGFHED